MSLSKTIAEYFSLTALEADELERKSLAVARAFINLRSAYSIDYLTETQSYADQKTAIGKKGRVGAFFGTATNRLSSKARTMWQVFAQCELAFDDFAAVCRTHPVQVSTDQALTKCFELAHEAHVLSGPEKVIEGRRIFDTLSREKHLATSIGFMGF